MRALLVGLLVFPLAASADCMSLSWAVSPPAGSTVPLNARFVLEGFGTAQDTVAKIASRNPRLVSESARLALEVIEVHVGEMGITQAVLKPRGALKPGTKYTLEFDDQQRDRFFLRGDQKPSWTAGPPDRVAPVWGSAPSPEPGRVAQMGCGPDIQAQVRLDVSDTSAVLIRARVKDGTASEREYLLTPRSGAALGIGHGMCSGAFKLPEGAWTLELSAVDAAGNITPAPGPPLRFKYVDPVPP